MLPAYPGYIYRGSSAIAKSRKHNDRTAIPLPTTLSGKLRGRLPGLKNKAPRIGILSLRKGTSKYASRKTLLEGCEQLYYDSYSNSKKEALYRSADIIFYLMLDDDKYISCYENNKPYFIKGYDEDNDRYIEGTKCAICTTKIQPCLWLRGKKLLYIITNYYRLRL